MRLFITGATGYIGLNVATAFRRVGYQVFGLTRSLAKASLLERNEIIPVVGSFHEPDGFRDITAQCDVIIHAATNYLQDKSIIDHDVVRFMLDASRDAAQRKTLIYNSAIWALGKSQNQPPTEYSPPSLPQAVRGWSQVEDMVLNAEGVKGLVIRSGIVYGRKGGLTGMWFHGASNGSVVQIVGDGQNRWAMVHVDDLAQGYLRAAHSNLAGETFILADSSRSTVMEMASVAAKAAGNIRQLEFIPVDKAIQKLGLLAEVLVLDQVGSTTKARRILDWQPRHKGFIPEVETYYRAWRANRAV